MARCEWTTRDTLIVLFVCLIVLIFLVDGAHAFGAGNIPSFAYLEDRAFRHGDIEDSLGELLKKSGGVLGGLGSKKFGGLDIKRVYFGNWLRDYSQAMDIAGLTKMSKQSIINIVMALGFLAHGYATGEFEVTEERLGVYLPVQHIDNPKGYGEGQDARKIHPDLRGPIDPRELEIDPQTAMKNYIANEQGGWDTSTSFIRRTLLKCIEAGRQARHDGREATLYEAYRLLGTALHTLEDLCAHSNWCELSLRRLGYHNVFCHVGDGVVCQTPSGPAPPLVTGTFGGDDFMHSLLGEATDHISEASVSDLNKAMDKARGGDRGFGDDALRDMLFQLPGGSGNSLSRDMDGVQGIRARAQPGSGFDPSQLSPQEMHATLWQVLKFRDDVCKTIERTIEKVPGLNTLVEMLTNAINKFVFTTLEPYLKPLMQTATSGLQSTSAAVIDKADQYEVFNDPMASDPTHSILSKDHFNLILNEPAGMLSKIIVRLTVKGVVEAWDSTSVDPHRTISKALEAFHHPYFVDGSSQVQREMGQFMKDWIGRMPESDKQYVLNALTKESVRAGRNKRKGHVDDDHPGCGHASIMGYNYTSFLPTPGQLGHQASGYAGQALHHVPGYNTVHGAMQTVGFREMPPDFDSREGPPPESFESGAPAPPQQSGGYSPGVDISTPAGYGTGMPGSEPPLRNDTFGGGGYGPPQSGGYGPPPGEGYGGPPPGERYGEGGYGPPSGGYGSGGYDDDRQEGGYGGYGPPPGQGGYGGGPAGFPEPEPSGGPAGWDDRSRRPPPPGSWGYQGPGSGGYPSGSY